MQVLRCFWSTEHYPQKYLPRSHAKYGGVYVEPLTSMSCEGFTEITNQSENNGEDAVKIFTAYACVFKMISLKVTGKEDEKSL